MMKSLIIVSLLLISATSFSQSEGNYTIVINDDSISIDLNSAINYQTSSGENLKIQVVQPDILTYSDEMISFSHHKSFTVSNTELDQDIEQCMILRSTGNGFMVQKFKTLDPSMLSGLMLNELTKESVSYGYSKKEKKFKKKISSGQTIEGIEATLEYNGEKEVYTVATCGGKDSGVIVVTMMLNEDFPEDKEIIDLFLNTLSINID